MNKTIKVGVHVRFLNAVGGGRVARITKDTAWVEDADGFEIPTPLNECVLVDEGDTFVPKYKPPTFLYTKEVEAHDKDNGEARHRPKVEDFEDFYPESHVHEERLPQRLPHTFLPARGEASVYLAFLPEDIARLGQTAYDWYLINDSTYSLYYVVAQGQESEPKLVHHGVLHPEQDIYLGRIEQGELAVFERLIVQLLAIAENPGIFKEHIGANIRFDVRRLLKGSSFVTNEFFEDKAYLLPIKAQDDAPKEVDTSRLVELSSQHSKLTQPKPSDKKSQKTESMTTLEPIVVDLHIEALLDDTTGMNATDMLAYQIGVFNKTMQAYLPKVGERLIFVHGKGDGVLRNKLISELKYRYKHCHYQDALFQQYSYGATQVTIGKQKS